MKKRFKIAPDEHFFGGAVNDGIFMPYKSGFKRDLRVYHGQNQAAAALISDRGTYIYSQKPFEFSLENDEIVIDGEDIVFGRDGDTLKSAYRAVKNALAPNAIGHPDEYMFIRPQYNTWIEMGFDCAQDKILRYAKDILANGFPAGVLMIDDCWCRAYGDWEFDAARFYDPRAMVDELHGMGFKVMLWCVPFVSADTKNFRYLDERKALVSDGDKPIVTHWWNGYSAVLDLKKPVAVEWFVAQMHALVDKYGVDGFKLDAGDPGYYPLGDNFVQTDLWAALGGGYKFNEMRVGFNSGKYPTANRLRDKNHSWTDDGLATLLPDGIAMGLCGYPFVCPDMIGGGLITSFDGDGFVFDTELFVRYCQVAAYFPMMQFSRMPWRVLSAKETAICLDAVNRHIKLADYIMNEVEKNSKSGEPILRSLEYEYPHCGYAQITDEFLLGSDILVAPQLNKGEKSRKVIIPSGEWADERGKIYSQGEYTIDTPIDVIPVFYKKS